jgi:elongation factor P--(R)-beta-lysine ligase
MARDHGLGYSWSVNIDLSTNSMRHSQGKVRKYLRFRMDIQGKLRDWFTESGFQEVQTPVLQISPGLEPHLHAFATEWESPGGGKAKRPLYLHTSPEFTMKKLVANGWTQIVQFAPVFRNREGSPLHSSEFTMLEWYRAHEPYTVLMEDCEALIREAAQISGNRLNLERAGKVCTLDGDFERLTVAEAVSRHTGADIFRFGAGEADPEAAQLVPLLKELGIYFASDDSWEDLFLRLLMERVEPFLGQTRPTFLYEYPISLAALARPKAEDPRVAERFELYVFGIELANAFGELTDPEQQRIRFLADQEKKQKLYGKTYPIDEELLALLGRMPPTSGIALGFDRLVVLCTGAQSIDEVLWWT